MSAGDDTNSNGPADPGAPDAWLRAALRHAPDADVAAPPALSAAILREAVAATGSATRRPAPTSVWQQLMAAWSWLARPPVAAGFASVMLASVIGLMWWDKPLNEVLPARAPEVAVASLPSEAPTPDATTPQAAATAAALPEVVREREATTARAAKAPASPIAERRRVAPGEALGKARPAVPADARRESTEALADAAQAAVPARPQAPEPAAPLAAPAVGALPPLRQPSPLAITAADPPGPAAPAAVATQAIPKLSARSGETRLSAPPAALLIELRTAIRADPQRWSWQRGAGPEQAMTAALRAWLDRLGEASATTEAAPASAAELRLLRDGQLHTTLALGAASLRVTPADTRRAPQQSALSPAAAAELKTALDAAAAP